MQYVVVVGDFSTGILSVHGPFEDKEYARRWASVNVGIQTRTIVPIRNQKENNHECEKYNQRD